jgi:mannose-6-phosphate isomerase-like protein (cupin superfamily)
MENDNNSPQKALIDAWQSYLKTAPDWQELITDITPKATGCGPIYDLPNPIDRPNEGFAIADMRSIKFAQPHYHANGEVEIYFVLEGGGRVVVGNKVQSVAKGDVSVTPSGTAHYAIPNPETGMVLAVINTPPFNVVNNIEVTQSDPAVQYDHQLFTQLTSNL